MGKFRCTSCQTSGASYFKSLIVDALTCNLSLSIMGAMSTLYPGLTKNLSLSPPESYRSRSLQIFISARRTMVHARLKVRSNTMDTRVPFQYELFRGASQWILTPDFRESSVTLPLSGPAGDLLLRCLRFELTSFTRAASWVWNALIWEYGPCVSIPAGV